MSELMNGAVRNTALRYWLLTTVSASACVLTAFVARAEIDSDQPTIWIDVGGQLERVEATREPFAPTFTQQFEADNYLLPDHVQKSPRYGNGFEGKLEVDPTGSPWSFAASLRYGRSNSAATSHHQVSKDPQFKVLFSVPALNIHFSQYVTGHSQRFADAQSGADESHLLLDFQAGRDVGLGVFKSTKLDFGIRVAQFQSRASIQMTADSGSDMHYVSATQIAGYPAVIRRPDVGHETWDLYHATALISRSFRGVGPSVGLNESVSLIGHSETMSVKFDFGANGALLFGRQKTSAHHQTLRRSPYVPHYYNFIPLQTVYHHSYDPSRSRMVTVPNVGGLAALSFVYARAKISVGYRADFFFGAIDTGIDTRRTSNVGLYGPFATISIGFGG